MLEDKCLSSLSFQRQLSCLFSLLSSEPFVILPQDVEPASPAALAGLHPYTDYVVGSDQILQEVRNPRCVLSGPPEGMWTAVEGISAEASRPTLGAAFRPCVSPSRKTSSHSLSPMRGSP